MFNRNNYPAVPSPFGGREAGSRPPQYNQAPQRPSYDTNMGGGYDPRTEGTQTPPRGGVSHRPSRSRGGQTWHLQPAKSPEILYTFRNLVAVSPHDIPPSQDGRDTLLLVKGLYVVSARPYDRFPQGSISLSDPQRAWMDIALTDTVEVELYDPFGSGGQAYLGAMDIEIGFASKTKRVEIPYDQDELAKSVVQLFQNQVFAPGQRFLMDIKSIPLLLVVKTIQLMDLSEKPSPSAPTRSDPHSRGILLQHTQINFFKDPKTPIQLKASNRRPATNSILAPDFDFKKMGIGGLDAEFQTIFRRAFASRLFPPGVVADLGIQHVKGILLYGPPGTGKTLIARKIGQTLNAREPKIINGPEVLNKYVGQSEENIRKLFADAEKEYKEKGDESGLHIIIFDELDAVCKKRGSGAGGGTGVGDSVVNQLLSKLDGVDQLNNILVIGMTNRLDMIDDALLRPGRLEAHIEISLPDEKGRVQILGIHTQKMRDAKRLAPDVDLADIAHRTKNFSGAEIAGLVKSATSFAFSRHTKGGMAAKFDIDTENMKVTSADFDKALEEIQPAFGVSQEELHNCITRGIIHYSDWIDSILSEGRLFVAQVREDETTPIFSVLLHGPRGSGKTALAAQIALESEFPLIKMVSNEDMVGFGEAQKIQHMLNIFMDAYKSPLSIVVVDGVEKIIDWSPIGPRFSNPVLGALMTLIRKKPPKNRRLLVLATTSDQTTLQNLDVFQDFNSHIPVPSVDSYEQLEYIMREVMQAQEFGSEQDIKAAIHDIKDISQHERFGVGIKTVLDSIATSKRDVDMAMKFAAAMRQAMNSR